MSRLLVLEIDGLLASLIEWSVEGVEPELMLGGRRVYKRPGADAFLASCFERFDAVGLWTTLTQAENTALVEALFAPASRFAFVWGQERCNERFDEREWQSYWIKDLHKLKSQGFELGQIVALDHEARHYQRSKSPLVLVPEFEPGTPDAGFEPLLDLLDRKHQSTPSSR